MEMTMKQCAIDNLFLLRELSYKTFDETFRPMNSPAVMDKKQGFYVIGKHPFYMGQEEQTDYIFRKDLLITGEDL
ncbi:MAG TPA: hypothetical protein DEF42_19095 [Desulfosporosinus sp.]|nr:hypothetical protein [Desulfosporosinus sp.]